MKKTVLLVFATFAVSMLTATPIVGKSKPFAVNTMIGDFKILDVKSDYCSGAYGKSSKQTFLSGVKCELEFTVSTTPFYDVDYITVNGETYNYPKFKFNVGSLGSGGTMKVVAVSKDGEKTEPFRVNLDVAKPHSVMAYPIANKKGDEVVYKSLCNGLSVFDASGFSLAGYWSDILKGTLTMDVKNKVQMSSSFESSSAKQNLEAANTYKVGTFGAMKKYSLNVAITGGESWRWKPSRNSYELCETRLGAKIPFDFKLWEPRFPPVCPVLFCRVGLEGEVRLDGLTYDWEKSAYRFKFSGNPSVYAGLGAGSDDCGLAAGFRGGGRFVINGGLPGSPDIVDEMYFQAYFHAYIKYIIGEVTFWELESEKAYLKGGSAGGGGGRSLLGSSRPNMLMAQGDRGNESFSRFVPTVATIGDFDVIAYHQIDEERTGVNQVCVQFRSGRIDGLSASETIWDDGTIDGVASIGADKDGAVVLAWENGQSILAGDVAMVDVLKNLEMAVAVRDPATKNWSAKNLTNDNAYDHSPRIVVPPTGNGYLAFWLSTDIENAGDEFSKPSRLMCARHVGGNNWKLKEIARTTTLPLVSYDVISREDGRFELLWAECDYEKGVQRTHHVSESGTIDSTGFGTISSVILGEKKLGVMPRFVDANCGSKIVWVEDGKLHTSPTVSFAAPVVVDTGSFELPPAFTVVNGSGETALVWSEIDGDDPAHPNHAYSLMYDSSEGRWGYPVRITDDVRDESQIKASIGDDKAIRLAYVATEVSTNGTGEVVTGASSLETYYSPTRCELVVERDGIKLSSGDLTMDTAYEVYTTIRNVGRRGTNGDVDVEILLEESNGNSALTGGEYGSCTSASLAGGEVVVLTNTVAFSTAATDYRYLSVMIDPWEDRWDELFVEYYDEEYGEYYTKDGTYINVGRPALGISHLTAEYDGSTNCLLTAKLRNTGTLAYPEGAKVVFHRGAVDGPVIGEDVIPSLPPGTLGRYSAGMTWDLTSASFSSPTEVIYAVLDVSGVEFEDDCEDAGASSPNEPLFADVDIVTPLDSNENGVWDGEEQMLATSSSYTIEYALGGGVNAASNPSEYTTNALPISLASPTRDGYAFTGWMQGPGVIECGTTGNLLFTAVWEKNGAKPEFVIENGELKSVTLDGAACITIPDTVTSIAADAFADETGLYRVTIPNSVTNIGAHAFSDVVEVLFVDRTAPLLIAEATGVPSSAVKVLPRGGGLSFVGWTDEEERFLPDPFGRPGGCFVKPVWAAKPNNDDFANALPVEGEMASVVGNNVGATVETGEPVAAHFQSAGATVWWRWTASQSGQFRFFTSGSGFDTVLGV